MATIAHNGYSVRHTANGDITNGSMFLNTVVWNNFGIGATLQVTDGNDVVVLPTIESADSGSLVSGVIVIPINRGVNGLKTVLAGATPGEVSYLLR